MLVWDGTARFESPLDKNPNWDPFIDGLKSQLKFMSGSKGACVETPCKYEVEVDTDTATGV